MNKDNIPQARIQLTPNQAISLSDLVSASEWIAIQPPVIASDGSIVCTTEQYPILVDPMILFDVIMPPSPEENLRYFTFEMSVSKGFRFQLLFYCDGDDRSFGITQPIFRLNEMQTYALDLKPLYTRLFATGEHKVITRMAMIPTEASGSEITIQSLAFHRQSSMQLTPIDPPAPEAESAVKGGSTDYIPDPVPAKTDYLIGAHYFPGWKHSTHEGWKVISPYPEKKPLLGFYDEGNPEVCDWEIKWALEHGISYFVYCWYGFPWTDRRGDQPFNALNHAIHDGLFNARFSKDFKFVINFCAHFGIQWLGDLADDLFPFWLETYFKHPSYLIVDNKPILMILDFEKVIGEIGMDAFRAALKKMDAGAKAAGFDGLSVSGMYWGNQINGIEQLLDAGFDSGFAYLNWSRWNIVESKRRPKAASFIADQKESLEFWMNADIDYLSAVSFMWDIISWYRPTETGGGMLDILRWRISPAEYEDLLRWTKEQMDKQDPSKLASKMLLLDNWNEYGEGHYMAPHTEYGFEYLDAVRHVFTDTNDCAEHTHLLPSDIGAGPYNTLYKESGEYRVFQYPPLRFDRDRLDMYLNA
jgi:hypothetical protein